MRQKEEIVLCFVKIAEKGLRTILAFAPIVELQLFKTCHMQPGF